jgi:hypothetical protein
MLLKGLGKSIPLMRASIKEHILKVKDNSLILIKE